MKEAKTIPLHGGESKVIIEITEERFHLLLEMNRQAAIEEVMKILKPKEEPTVTVEKAAKHLNICEEHVKRLARKKVIPGYKKPGLPWEFYLSELNEYVRSK